jgi:hypothetical protein
VDGSGADMGMEAPTNFSTMPPMNSATDDPGLRIQQVGGKQTR